MNPTSPAAHLVAADSTAQARRFIDAAHSIALVVILALRCLVWDGEAFSSYNLVFIGLLLAAVFILVMEVLTGLRRELRWSWTAVAVAVFTAVLVPAAYRAHLPVEAWSITGQALVHALFGLWLIQIVPGRERLAWAALAAGLAGQAAISCLQWVTVMPGLRQQIESGAINPAVDGVDSGDLLERVARGGLFGTFTVSNTLAAYLGLIGVPAIVWAATVARGPLRWLAWFIAALAIAALLGTGSKGGWFALAIATAIGGLVVLQGWKRLLPLALAGLVIPAMLFLPTVRGSLAASAEVRWQYWQGALKLVEESPVTGHGVTAFIERGVQVMPLAAEPTRLVHNEVLEAAVIGGIPLALLLAAILLSAAWAKRSAGIAVPPPGNLHPLAIIGAITFAITYLGLFHAFSGNLEWWPGRTPLTALGWAVVLGLGIGTLVTVLRNGPPPPPWALRLGVGVVALHALIDFDLHAFVLVGCVIAVAVLARPDRPVIAIGWPLRAVLPLGWGAVVAMFVMFCSTAASLNQARDLMTVMRTIQLDQAHRQEAVGELAALLGQPMPKQQKEAQALNQLAFDQAWNLAQADPALARDVASMCPPGAERLELLDGLVSRLPFSGALAIGRADCLLALHRWDEGFAELQRAVDLAPSHLPSRLRLAAAYDQAIQMVSANAGSAEKIAEWRAKAGEIRAEVAVITPNVHPRNRPKAH